MVREAKTNAALKVGDVVELRSGGGAYFTVLGFDTSKQFAEISNGQTMPREEVFWSLVEQTKSCGCWPLLWTSLVPVAALRAIDTSHEEGPF